jgi:peroxiredoxin Q/BCP
MSELLKPGDTAPSFNLPDQSGHEVSLSSFGDRKVLVYFYPKADTPGCTAQACALRDVLGEVGSTAVIGISPDPPKRQAAFDSKYSLGFPLLSDVSHTVAESYGVWVERSMYGRTYMGIQGSPCRCLPRGRGRGIGERLVQGGAGGDRREPAQGPRQVALRRSLRGRSQPWPAGPKHLGLRRPAQAAGPTPRS